MDDMEREIDHRIELSGIRLGPGLDELRERHRRQIKLNNDRRAAMSDQPIPTFRLRL